jgi:hypothetical protein
MWDETRIAVLLRTNDNAVERAIVRLYKRQTLDERRDTTTRHLNRIGFSASDAKRGSRFARWVLQGKRLTGWHLEQAREMALKYRRQLVDVANR